MKESLRNGLLVTLTAALGCASTTGVCGCYADECSDTSLCDVGPSCPGQCLPLPPIHFKGPTLLWTGPEADAPLCPDRAPSPVYEGYAGLDGTHACPPCGCTEPACVFPAGLTASSQACANAGGGTLTAFEAPAGWSGACTSPTTVASNLLSSVTLAPASARPCEPVAPEVPQDGSPHSPWSTFARACMGEVIEGACADPGTTCEPTAEPPPPGFRQCILYQGEGDPACPTEYPDKHIFYEGLEDTRECTPCECAQTVPSSCSALVSYYQDDACATLSASIVVDSSAGASCHDIMVQGAELGSMEAAWVMDEPGACVAGGGAPVGEAKPAHPSTFCCQPPP